MSFAQEVVQAFTHRLGKAVSIDISVDVVFFYFFLGTKAPNMFCNVCPIAQTVELTSVNEKKFPSTTSQPQPEP